MTNNAFNPDEFAMTNEEMSLLNNLSRKISALEAKHKHREKTSVIRVLIAHARSEWSAGNYLQVQVDLASISKLERKYLRKE